MAGPTMAREMIDYRLRSVVRHSLATLLATTALGSRRRARPRRLLGRQFVL
ncbi:hypothetical protein ACVIIW_006895 [Bradyrhizobium sp. USDA 4449]